MIPTTRRSPQSPRRMQWIAFTLLALLALGSLPAAVRAQQFISYFEPSECPVETPEEVTVECGFVVVPQSHNNFDGTVLRLATVILRSPNPDKLPDPVFYLEGGPGGSALAGTSYYAELFAPLLTKRDVVLFDQRGAGYSEPSLSCEPETETLGVRFPFGIRAGEDLPEEVKAQAAFLEACLRGYAAAGYFPSLYNTTESAADIEDIRRALGFGQINLLGISYGTRLGLEAMLYRPETLRSVVLDSSEPPQDALFTGPFYSASLSFSRLFAACAAEAACNAAYGDLGADFDAVASRLNAAPVVLPIFDLETGEIIDYLPFSGVDFASLVFSYMYVTELIPLMPALISTAADADYELLSILLSAALTGGGDGPPFAIGMLMSVLCDEEARFTTPEDMIQARSRNPRAQFWAYGPDGNELTFNICAAGNAGRDDPVVNRPITSDLPTFVLGGEFDPITPPENATATASTLSRSYVALYPRGGHAVMTASPCLQAAVAQFIDNPAAAPDTSCIAAEAPLPFATPDELPFAASTLEANDELLRLLRRWR